MLRKGLSLANILKIYRSGKRALAPKIRVGYERFKQFFMLPGCYRKIRAEKACARSSWGLAVDLMTWFFSYRTFPEHYGPGRLGEVEKTAWKYYYGSNYLPHQQARLQRSVQPLEYRILFNDKYICALLCQALGFKTPQTNGVLDPRQDYRSRIGDWLKSRPARPLIIKPLYGEMGRDIVMAKSAGTDDMIVSSKGSVPLAEYVLQEKAIVQEFLVQDPRMAEFSPSSVNTLRLVTMLTPQTQVIIVYSVFRSGVGKAIVDNFSAGGVLVDVDCDRGVLRKYAYDKNSNRYASHPTSGIAFEGHPVPAWHRVRAFAEDFQRSFPFYRMIGLDIALDWEGDPVIIEANGQPDLGGYEQAVGPLLKNEEVLKAFGEYGLLVNKHQRRLYKAQGKL